MRAYWTTFLVIGSYLWLGCARGSTPTRGSSTRCGSVHLRNARRIERTIIELQGLFIKVGQLISIMTNFLPEEFRRELEGLQDAVPPRPYPDIEARIREELGKPPDELFAQFERSRSRRRRSVRSTSRGCTTARKVAVKVQYPDIEEIVRRDLITLRRIFRIVEWFVPYQGLDELYREIRAIMIEELDYRAEADNTERIAANFEGRTDVALPARRRTSCRPRACSSRTSRPA